MATYKVGTLKIADAVSGLIMQDCNISMEADEAQVKDENGNIIGVPWVWGTTSLFYNADVITDEITSWSALWNPQYAGKVAFENEYDAAIRTAAMYTGEDPRNPDTDTVTTSSRPTPPVKL